MIRLYEFVKSVHFHELEEYTKSFPLDELRRRLDAETYPRFCNFNQRVLKPAVEEVNTYTDKEVVCRPVKEGRRVNAVELTIRTKDVEDRLKTRVMIDRKLGPAQLSLWDGDGGDGT